jgi:hypothetical protein
VSIIENSHNNVRLNERYYKRRSRRCSAKTSYGLQNTKVCSNRLWSNLSFERFALVESGSGHPRFPNHHDNPNHRGRDVKLPHRQPSPPPCRSFHDGRELGVPVQVRRKDMNEDRNRMSRSGSGADSDSTDQQSSRPPSGIPKCSSCTFSGRFVPQVVGDRAPDSPKVAVEHHATRAAVSLPQLLVQRLSDC